MNSPTHENDWEYVYSLVKSPETIGLPYDGLYYQTYGGGPEGGYLVSDGTVYCVSRSWSETWKVEEAQGVLHVKVEDDSTYVKCVQKDAFKMDEHKSS